jgi:hypothetical protein
LFSGFINNLGPKGVVCHNRIVKYWEIIADNLKKRGWSLGWVSAVARAKGGSESGVANYLAELDMVHVMSRAQRFTRRESISRLELKHMEHFEEDDDNDNDSDDVEDVSVHGSWITRRYPRLQAK